MEIKNIILGGGIAGLVYGYYNPGIIISPEFGGQMASHFPLGPRYLHLTEYSEQFLKDIGLPIKVITIKTGYQILRGKVADIMLDKTYREKYFMKSRGQMTLDGYDATVMSENKNSFQALEVNFENLISILCAKLNNRLKLGKVVSIKTKDKIVILESGEQIKYDKLVNTMPLNVFAKIIDEPNFPSPDNFKCSTITYIWLKPQKFTGYNYIYVAQDNLPYHRLTWDEKGMIAEIFGAKTPEECKKFIGDDYIDSKILWNAQIIPFNGKLEIENIKFIGRYGNWDRKWLTELVIEKSIQEKNKNGN